MLKAMLPIIYLLLGYTVFSRWENLKKQFSYVLTRGFIPAAIIINLSHNFISAALIILFFFFTLCALFTLGKKIEKKPIFALCFCYLNMGWLGFPLSVLFLSEIQRAILLNAYIGNSLFGNTIGVHTFLKDNERISVKNLFRQPTVVAVIIGTVIALIPFDLYSYFKPVESYIHICLSFLGMSILGMWLKTHSVNRESLKDAGIIQLKKLFIFSAIAVLMFVCMKFFGIQKLCDIIVVWMYISLLPPAANIIVLETYYKSNGRSAPVIVSGTIISISLLAVLTLAMFSRPYLGL